MPDKTIYGSTYREYFIKRVGLKYEVWHRNFYFYHNVSTLLNEYCSCSRSFWFIWNAEAAKSDLMYAFDDGGYLEHYFKWRLNNVRL